MILSDFFSRFDSAELIGLIALTGGMIVGLILGIMGILLGFYNQRLKYRRAEILAAIKQDMLSRGMSANEICMVLEAGARSETDPEKNVGLPHTGGRENCALSPSR